MRLFRTLTERARFLMEGGPVPVRNPLFVTLSDGTIRNTYDIRLRNKLGSTHDYTLTVTSADPFTLRIEGVEGNVISVPANDTLSTRLYLEAAPGSAAAQRDRTDLRLWVSGGVPEAGGKEMRVHHDTVFNGKAQ